MESFRVTESVYYFSDESPYFSDDEVIRWVPEVDDDRDSWGVGCDYVGLSICGDSGYVALTEVNTSPISDVTKLMESRIRPHEDLTWGELSEIESPNIPSMISLNKKLGVVTFTFS